MSVTVSEHHLPNLQGGGKRGTNAPPIFFLPMNSAFAWINEVQIKNLEWLGGGGRDVCMLTTGSNQSSPSL